MPYRPPPWRDTYYSRNQKAYGMAAIRTAGRRYGMPSYRSMAGRNLYNHIASFMGRGYGTVRGDPFPRQYGPIMMPRPRPYRVTYTRKPATRISTGLDASVLNDVNDRGLSTLIAKAKARRTAELATEQLNKQSNTASEPTQTGAHNVDATSPNMKDIMDENAPGDDEEAERVLDEVDEIAAASALATAAKRFRTN